MLALVESSANESWGRKKKRLAEGDNEVVRVEKTPAFRTVRMRKNQRKGETQIQKQARLMYYC